MMTLSLAVAVVLLVAKTIAAAMTGSSAIYSDAAESVTHLLAVAFAAWALRLAHKPSDDTHHFGHDKVAFISSGFEGAMISAAALLILYDAGRQAISGSVIESMGLGILVTAGAAAVNLVLGMALLRVGRKHNSQVLRANGEHVLADVWTSGAVIIALGLVYFTGWRWWDPICAILAGSKLLWTGWRLMRESFGGLMDEADLAVEKELRDILDADCATRGLSYHNLRHRHSGRTHWVEFHLVFPDETDLGDAHEIATELEGRVAAQIGQDVRVISHLEPRSAEHQEEPWELR
ncbi:cation diffusion facilitator family transporter [Luteolibacter flavescens]|uniref:Cation diffusion facilitator family transporter n=1 Tax=Luteolibacter flavescens TaxID=1859460 RepID=A0ABT3FPZ7_9BACT|nr:cation diffusion facilitator family transporter [Luteolibacter flavescens]MCW1885645.1 cation diffusion facilitator family transporter [Luteolibacter flavescens]